MSSLGKMEATKKQLDDLAVSLTLSPRGQKILDLLGAGNALSRVAKSVGISKATMTYWLKKFKRLGLIQLQSKDVLHTYSLTPLGSTFITRCEDGDGVGLVVELEDFRVKFEVLEWEKYAIEWRKLGSPRNWQRFSANLGGVFVERTSKSVIVHTGRLKGWNPYELCAYAGQICERVRTVLETRFGMVLKEGVPIQKVPRFHVNDPAAKEIIKELNVEVNGVGAIDASPPSKEPHVEFNGPILASQYLTMPLKLADMVEKVDCIQAELQDIKAGMLPVLRAWSIVGNRLLDVIAKLEGAKVGKHDDAKNHANEHQPPTSRTSATREG